MSVEPDKVGRQPELEVSPPEQLVSLEESIATARWLFPELFNLATAIQRNKKEDISVLSDEVKQKMPVLATYLFKDSKPGRALNTVERGKVFRLIEAFGGINGEKPIDKSLREQLQGFFPTVSFHRGNKPNGMTVLLGPGIEESDASQAYYFSKAAEYYEQVLAVQAPKGWFTELGLAGYVAAVNAWRYKQMGKEGISDKDIKKLQVVTFSFHAGVWQDVINLLQLKDLEQGKTSWCQRYNQAVDRTVLVAPPTSVAELPGWAKAAVKAVGWIVGKVGLEAATWLQNILLPENEIDISRSWYLSKRTPLEEWQTRLITALKRAKTEGQLPDEVKTIQDYNGSQFPLDSLIVIGSKEDKVVGLPNALATIWGRSCYPLVRVEHGQTILEDRVWEEITASGPFHWEPRG